EGGEDPAKGVVRGDTVRQRQPPLEPRQLGAAEQFDLVPGIGAGEDGTQGNREDVGQQMQPAVLAARVFQASEMIDEGQLVLLHGGSSTVPVDLQRRPETGHCALPITSPYQTWNSGAPPLPAGASPRPRPSTQVSIDSSATCTSAARTSGSCRGPQPRRGLSWSRRSTRRRWLKCRSSPAPSSNSSGSCTGRTGRRASRSATPSTKRCR